LEIGQFDNVAVCNPQHPDAGPDQLLGDDRPQRPTPDEQNGRGAQPRLPIDADLRQE
jgi:hypothetical protein